MTFKERFERLRDWIRSLDPRLRVLIGVLFISLGLLALVTPLTPGAWLVFVGLEFIGIRLAFWNRLLNWWHGRKEAAEEQQSSS